MPLFKLAVLLTAFGVALPAASQTLSEFSAVPVPTAPASVDVSPLREVPPDVFLRETQQTAVRFVHNYSYINGAEIFVNDVLVTEIGRVGGSSFLWSSPPTELGEHQVTVAYQAGANDEVRDFRLFVVPAATRAFTATEQTSDATLTHTMLVWSGHDGGGTLDRPLLVVEGIDGDNVNPAAAYYALGIRDEAPLFLRGQAEGADIVVLDFGDGGRRIQDNAAVVRQALLDLPDFNQDPSRQLDVAGVSMGGVVARYALAKMEQDGEEHRTRVFASIDAPQQGAVLDRRLQTFI